jgi:hypothetical protein
MISLIVIPVGLPWAFKTPKGTKTNNVNKMQKQIKAAFNFMKPHQFNSWGEK